MSRQNPNLLASASNLRSSAAAIRAAVGSGTFEDLKAALTAAAGAFEQAEGAFSSIEQRFRDLGDANVNDPRRPAGVLVSGDRIRGGVQVQGGLRSVMGQGMDLTFETAVSHVKSFDHGADGYLELDLDGLGVVINAHGGTITLTGTLSLSVPLPIAQGGTNNVTAAAAFNALSPMTTLGDVIYGGTSGAGTRLAGNITTTKKFLRQTGGGAASAAPAWDTVDAGDVTSGTLALARGGTASGTGSITGSGALTFTSGGATAVVLKPGTDSTTAVQLQNAAGVAVLSVDTSGRIVSVSGDANIYAGSAAAAQLAVHGATVSAKQLAIGFDTTADIGILQSYHDGVAVKPLVLQPAGGNVGIGATSAPTAPLQVVGLATYANNAAAVTAGLTAGALYRSNADPDVVQVVH